ncbi:hypothetical protein B566_EDAN014470 [Ephemera danica]|nr:hypothetical protein B566_EDAN014470 [Ephemera danica]
MGKDSTVRDSRGGRETDSEKQQIYNRETHKRQRQQKVTERQTQEELVYDGADEGRNWRGILLSLLVISLVIAGIVFAIHTLGYVDELLYLSGRRMTLAQLLGGELQPRRLPPAWRQLDVQGFQVSADRKFVLFRHNMRPVFQNTFTAFYTVYDVTNDLHLPVRLTSGAATQTRLQHASWLGNTTSLLLAHENDLYIQKGNTTIHLTRLTKDGLMGRHSDGSAAWPSMDGSRLLYAAFNDSGVRLLQVPWLAASAGVVKPSPVDGIFPEMRTVHYPTPGSPNPEVRLWIKDLENLESEEKWEILPPDELREKQFYLTSAGWVSNSKGHVAATWMNRAQNLSIVTTCQETLNWTCQEAHVERAIESSWVDVQPGPVFSKDGGSMLVLSPVQEGASDFFTHITHTTLALPQRLSVISHGRHEVERVIGWHSQAHLVYYLGTHESGPGQRHLYVAADPGVAASPETRRLEPRCLTCTLHDAQFVNCSYYSASLSPSGKFIALECQGPGTPCAAIFESLSSLRSKFKLVHMLYKNYQQRGNPTSTGMAGSSSAVSGGDVGARMAQIALPSSRTFEVPLPQNSRARVQLLLPPSWREELRDAAFPVLVEVNGRPGSQAVDEKFGLDWGTYMSSHNDVVYVRLDVRGSSGQGRRASHAQVCYIKFACRYLLDTLSFLDETRVGLWGWGYGGYVTTMVLGSQQSIFKYSAFTERVLGSPEENFKGYLEADATQHARHIPNHALFLLHGLADLSTPFPHGIALARALSDAGVLFRYHPGRRLQQFLITLALGAFHDLIHAALSSNN